MVCTYCGSKLKTTNSRHLARSNGTWRRKKCNNCNKIFTTIELSDYKLSWLVNKNDKLTPFNRDLLFISIFNSLKHRNSAINEASELSVTVINKIQSDITDAVINVKKIKEITYNCLKNFDFVASIQYKAYYIDK